MAGDIVQADSKFLEILGLESSGITTENVRGMKFDALMPDAFTPRPTFARFSPSYEVRRFETCHRSDSASARCLQLDSYMAADEATGVPLVHFLLQDITDQCNTEKALRASERRFRLLAENIPGVIYLCENDSRYTMKYLNDHVEVVTGYPKQLFLSDEISMTDLYHPADVRTIYSQVDEALAARAPFHLIYRMRHRSGEWRWIEEYGTGVFDEKTGELLFLEGFLHDISERHSAQTALQESEARYRFLAHNSTDIIARIDIEGRFEYLSPAVTTLLGMQPEEMTSCSVYEFIHPEERSRIEAFHRRIRGRIGRYSIEHRLRHADGSYPWLETSLHVMLNESTGKREVIAIMRDVTERRRLREEIQKHAEHLEELVVERTQQVRELEAQRAEMEKLAATGRMAAGVAHEINNPLTGIRNCLLILARTIEESHPDRQFVDLAQREIERITRIVRQMYQLYRPEADKASRINLEHEIHDVCMMLERKFARKGIEVRLETASGLREAMLSGGYLRQILYNLLLNAMDASPENGVIEVHTGLVHDRIEIRVIDHGEGIGEDILPKVFEPFFTTKGLREGSGMGLGLSVSRSLATAMNAELSVATAPGAGAVFKLLLAPGATLTKYDRKTE